MRYSVIFHTLFKLKYFDFFSMFENIIFTIHNSIHAIKLWVYSCIVIVILIPEN